MAGKNVDQPTSTDRDQHTNEGYNHESATKVLGLLGPGADFLNLEGDLMKASQEAMREMDTHMTTKVDAERKAFVAGKRAGILAALAKNHIVDPKDRSLMLPAPGDTAIIAQIDQQLLEKLRDTIQRPVEMSRILELTQTLDDHVDPIPSTTPKSTQSTQVVKPSADQLKKRSGAETGSADDGGPINAATATQDKPPTAPPAPKRRKGGTSTKAPVSAARQQTIDAYRDTGVRQTRDLMRRIEQAKTSLSAGQTIKPYHAKNGIKDGAAEAKEVHDMMVELSNVTAKDATVLHKLQARMSKKPLSAALRDIKAETDELLAEFDDAYQPVTDGGRKKKQQKAQRITA